MDYYNQMSNQTNGNMPGQRPVYVQSAAQPENQMSTAAMVTGIIALVSVILIPLFPFLPFIFSGVSIALAMLSRGSNKRFSSHARAGLVTSSCGLVLTFLLFALVIYLITSVAEYQDEWNRAYDRIYEETYNEFYFYQ